MDNTSLFRTPRSLLVRILIGTATLVAGGVVFATGPLGATGGDDAAFVPIAPCRLFDTRPGPENIGPRSTPLGAGETYVVQVTGTNGNCTVPAEATAVAINATAVGATASSYATFYPAGGERPLSSSLNYVPAAAPTPNSIDVRLSADGKMAIYNAFGTVHMVGDVTGYYSRSALSELAAGLSGKADADSVYTKAQIDALLAGLSSDSYTDEEIDVMLAGLAPQGYTDAEIDAMLMDKADRATTYAKHEVDDLLAPVAADLAGKADAADVYTKAELDALHQLLYTKDEVDEMLVADRVWAADVDDNGDKLADGPYTSARLGVGWYRITFQLAPFEIPDTAEPVVAAAGRCGGILAVVNKDPIVAGGILQMLIVDVITYNHGGIVTDCALDAMVRLVD